MYDVSLAGCGEVKKRQVEHMSERIIFSVEGLKVGIKKKKQGVLWKEKKNKEFDDYRTKGGGTWSRIDANPRGWLR